MRGRHIVQQVIFYILNKNLVRPLVLNEQLEKSLEKIEAVISDLLRNSEDLSDVVAAQDKEISSMKDSLQLSLINISEPTRPERIWFGVFLL